MYEGGAPRQERVSTTTTTTTTTATADNNMYFKIFHNDTVDWPMVAYSPINIQHCKQKVVNSVHGACGSARCCERKSWVSQQLPSGPLHDVFSCSQILWLQVLPMQVANANSPGTIAHAGSIAVLILERTLHVETKTSNSYCATITGLVENDAASRVV